jgi:hypothetical protein
MYVQPSGSQLCRYFVTALIFQCVWSAVLAGVDVYAMMALSTKMSHWAIMRQYVSWECALGM